MSDFETGNKDGSGQTDVEPPPPPQQPQQQQQPQQPQQQQQPQQPQQQQPQQQQQQQPQQPQQQQQQQPQQQQPQQQQQISNTAPTLVHDQQQKQQQQEHTQETSLQSQMNQKNEQLPTCSNASTCMDCQKIKNILEGLSSCEWNGNLCTDGSIRNGPVHCPKDGTMMTDNNISNNDNKAIFQPQETSVAMWLGKATESGLAHVIIAIAFFGVFYVLRKRGILVCNRGKSTKYESVDNTSPSSSPLRSFGATDVLGGFGSRITGRLHSNNNAFGSNNFSSETVPLSNNSNASADEEWGWEEGESHVEMAGVPMSNNFLSSSHVYSSSSREEDDLRLAMAVSTLEEQRTPTFATINNGTTSYTMDSRTSPLTTGIPTHITSFAPKVTTTIKPKPVRKEDDIFATLGLSARPNFGGASTTSSVASLPKQNINNNSTTFALINNGPVSFSAVSSVGTQPKPFISSNNSINNSKPYSAAVKKDNHEVESFHSGGASEWVDDDDLDDLLND